MIVLDIDGVVADTSTMILEESNYEIVFDRYHPEDRENRIVPIIHKIFSTRMAEIEPYPDASVIVSTIDKYLGPITFLTARDIKYMNATRQWLEDNFHISFSLIFLSSSNKINFFKDIKARAFVEDRLATANTIAASSLVRTYLINRPWNLGRETHKDVIRINSLIGFYSREVSR